MHYRLMAYCNPLHLFSCLMLLFLALTSPANASSRMIPANALTATAASTNIQDHNAAAGSDAATFSRSTGITLPIPAEEPSSPPDPTIASAFDTWAEEHGLTFSPAEKERRLPIFAQNLAFIHSHNSRRANMNTPPADGGNRTNSDDDDDGSALSYTLGLNAFSHLTREEFADLMGTKQPGRSRGRSARVVADRRSSLNGSVGAGSKGGSSTPIVGAMPTTVDWRAKGKVTSVKKQSSTCGQWSAVVAFRHPLTRFYSYHYLSKLLNTSAVMMRRKHRSATISQRPKDLHTPRSRTCTILSIPSMGLVVVPLSLGNHSVHPPVL